MGDSLLGRVIWYELLTSDVKAAEEFYTQIVGWTVAPFKGSKQGPRQDPQQDYHLWMRTPDKSIGGVMKIPDGMSFPPHWGMYIGVPRLEDVVTAIQRRGGKPLTPVTDVPEVGRMCTMADPQGAAFSLLEPAMRGTPSDTEAQIGDTSWHELYTTDAEAAMKFYTELFGWQATEPFDMGPMGKYYMFARGVAFGGGMMNKPKEMAQVPPHWGFYFRVPDVHAAAERVKQRGGQILNGPMEVPGGDWAVNCTDPQGAAFSLHHKKK